MANPGTRQQLVDYCLRKLGEPVVRVNVANVQIEDRIDEAFQYWREYHFDATEEVYLKTQVTPSTIILQTNTASSYSVGETVVGETSNTVATVHAVGNTNVVQLWKIAGTFQNGETLTGQTSGHSASLVNTAAVNLGSYDKRYFGIDDSVIGVIKVLPLRTAGSGSTGDAYMFDYQYQLMLNDLPTLLGFDVQTLVASRQWIEMVNQLTIGANPVRFNRHTNKLHVDMDWNAEVSIGDYLIVNALQIVDPETYTDAYNDMVLKRLAVALIKKQWGENMKKYQGITLPGGVDLNGDKIWQEAVEELTKLEDEMQSRWEIPPSFSVA